MKFIPFHPILLLAVTTHAHESSSLRAVSSRQPQEERGLNFWTDFTNAICSGLTSGLPAEECSCVYDLGSLSVNFDCDVNGINLDCFGPICPTSQYNGQFSLGGGYSTTMTFQVVGQEMSITGNHCAEDRGEFCGECSVSLAGRKCQGCSTDQCSGLRVTPDCDNLLFSGLGIFNTVLPRCMGLNGNGNFEFDY